jgi:hypothetical protein
MAKDKKPAFTKRQPKQMKAADFKKFTPRKKSEPVKPNRDSLLIREATRKPGVED